MTKTQTWNHPRKGRITGTIVADSGDFVDIQLVTDHNLRALSVSERGVTQAGEIVTVRRSMLTEIPQEGN